MTTIQLIADQFSGMLLEDLTTLERNILNRLVDDNILDIIDTENGKTVVFAANSVDDLIRNETVFRKVG